MFMCGADGAQQSQGMGESSPSREPTAIPAKIPTLCYGKLQYLEGEILALVGVGAGLKASLVLSTCCASLRDSLACSVLDEQLFGRLYAALAGVEEPFDAFLQPPPRHNLSKRLQPSAVPLQSNAPDHDHPRHLQLGHCGALSSTALLSQSVPSLLSPLDKTEPPAAKRSRPGSHGCPPAEEVTARVAACPNDTSKPAACSLRVGQRDLRAGGEGRVSEPAETQQRGRQLKTWKMRLKEGIATGRKPSETFVFAGQSKGKHDVLLAVVPSTPPLIAITCTTRMALFSLDGTRLPVSVNTNTNGVQSAGDPRPREPQGGDATLAETADATALEGGGVGVGGARLFPQRGSPVAQRTSCFAFGSSTDGDGGDGEGLSQSPDAAAEVHQRDIRCLAASPAGDMIATGSLDCTIRVRSVHHPGCDWVRRLRGHEAGIRCLAFHRMTKRLVSADSRGMMAVWDIFPVSRRLQVVQGHSDSVQVLTWTGGGERLASGALDGSVAVWSMSAEGTLRPVVTYGGLCHPYRLVAVGRCLVFTSSAAPTILMRHSSSPSGAAGSKRGKGRDRSGGDDDGDDGGGNDLLLAGSKGARLSVVDVDPASSTQRDPGCRWVSTGLARLQHLVAGECLGTVMLSQTESWAEDSDSSADGEDAFLGGGRVTYRPPRLCRVVGASRVRSFEDFQAARSREESKPSRDDCGGRGAGDGGALEADWVNVSGCWSAVEQQPELPPRGGRSSADDEGNDNDHREDVDVCTCAAFVGRTLFLGYDTGFIYAHRAFDGRQLYRLGIFGSVMHLVEAEGSLFAYASSGVVSRWSWDA